MKKFLFFVVFIFFVSNKLFAAQGCLKGGLVYTSPPSGWRSWWTDSIDDSCSSGASTSDTYAYVYTISNSACSVALFNWGGSGVLVDYSIMNCPIDDYIPILIVLTGSTYFLFLKRFTRKNTYNEIL